MSGAGRMSFFKRFLSRLTLAFEVSEVRDWLRVTTTTSVMITTTTKRLPTFGSFMSSEAIFAFDLSDRRGYWETDYADHLDIIMNYSRPPILFGNVRIRYIYISLFPSFEAKDCTPSMQSVPQRTVDWVNKSGSERLVCRIEKQIIIICSGGYWKCSHDLLSSNSETYNSWTTVTKNQNPSMDALMSTQIVDVSGVVYSSSTCTIVNVFSPLSHSYWCW